ncbi:hypothetical protein BH24ACT15_BH24ACT15_07480 [soil metagenome]
MTQPTTPPPLRERLPEAAFALAMVATGVWAFAETSSIRITGSANAVGPRGFPYFISAALVIAGGVILFAVAQGHVGIPEDSEDLDVNERTHWLAVVKITAAFFAHVLLLDTRGWALACALLFAGTAWALGAVWWRAVGIALVLGLVIHLAFVNLLNVFLPPGVLSGLELFNG